MGKYKIINPYQTVDWNTWKPCKANLHTHSNVSDGCVDFADMIEAHYTRNFDILAMTDHGVADIGWTMKPHTIPLFSYKAIFKKPRFLTDKRYFEISTGADRGGRPMTAVPFGIEHNPSTISKCHVNGFFVNYGWGRWGKENDFEGPVAAIDSMGGLSHINHPGDWLGSGKTIQIAKDKNNIRFFSRIFQKYSSCLGLEVLNGHDTVTRYDRVLWDGLLEKVIPTGRNIWGFANSDAHLTNDIDTCFEVFMLPENTINHVRTAMENGTFFACGRYARPELGENFVGKGDYPTITNILVSEELGQITIQGAGFDKIEWIAKGEVIAAGNTINLNAHENQIGCYVRAQLLGPGGICLTQAFSVDNGRPPLPEPEISYSPTYWEGLLSPVKNIRIFVFFDKLIKHFR